MCVRNTTSIRWTIATEIWFPKLLSFLMTCSVSVTVLKECVLFSIGFQCWSFHWPCFCVKSALPAAAELSLSIYLNDGVQGVWGANRKVKDETQYMELMQLLLQVNLQNV